jgi:hypothetical protein
MPMTHDITNMIRMTQQVLAKRYDWCVSLNVQQVVVGAKSVVVRVAVKGSTSRVPETLVIKQIQSIGGIACDPTSTDPSNPAQLLFNEWAACEFLNTIACHPPLAPRFYAGDQAHGLIVLEDLGDVDGPTTVDPMQTPDREHAIYLLMESVRALAQLHGMTAHQYQRYQQIRQALGSQTTPAALFQESWPRARLQASSTQECDAIIERYQALRHILGLQSAQGIETEIAHSIHIVEDNPGPFLTLCQGDQNMPGRLLCTGALPRRFDFDQAGFRHALLEGMPGRTTWGAMLRIPPSVVSDMERVYQERLALRCSAAADPACYRDALLAAGARWHIFHVLNRIPAALGGDAPRGLSSRRQQNIAWQDAFAQLSEECGGLAALGCSAREIAAQLRRAWPDVEPLPLYPAFINGS